MKHVSRLIASVIMLCLLFTCTVDKQAIGDKQATGIHNNIRLYLVEKATEITDNSLSGMNSLDEWENVRNRRYDALIDMMGLSDFPLQGNRSPLNITVTGTIQQEGFHIVKLYYESLPGLYVPANLYVPDNAKEPLPAILYVCGHSPTQKVNYQAHPRKFAQLGFVCLIIETVQFGEVRGEHWGCYARGWFNWYSRGYNPGGVELWNAIRGLDVLSAMPEVNPEKIGVTGISGGGAQSWYIAAADARVKAVAPVCGASTLKAQITTRTIDGHCDCMMPINTYRQDFTDIGALIAPRPLLICQADRDGINTIESVRELCQHLRGIYTLYHAGENIGLVETPGGHSYHKRSREEIFSFFLKHLAGKDVSPEEAGDIEVMPQNLLPEDTLRVYTNGPPAGDRTLTIQDSFIALPPEPVITNMQELSAFRDSVRKFLLIKTFGAFPDKEIPFAQKLEFRALDGGRFGEEIYSFVPEEGWQLKLDIHWEHRTDSLSPLLIVLRSPGEERWESESFAGEISHDQNIAFLEVRGVGEIGWALELQWHILRAAAWTGRTIASMQVYDLLRCLAFCRTLPGVDPSKISIAARDEMGVVALYAALMDGKCESLVLRNPPETQDQPGDPGGKGPATEMLNCLRIIDVYQIPALLSPATVTFSGDIPHAYRWSETLLRKLGREGFAILR
ncbi:MAG TPA: acetylxylan esterase [Bacteroidales bacterium]|nr:acetylxylan esterase [Bacteroidales bacterium]